MNWRTRWQTDRAGLTLILGSWLIFFWPLIWGRWMYFLDDLKIIYYPLETQYAAFQHAWQLPYWSNLFGFGQPLLSWGQLGFFTPLHLILRALNVPPLDHSQISVMVYYLLGISGAYLFAHRRHFSPAPSAALALLFAFNGFSIGHLNHVNFYTTTMLLPWLLVASDALVHRPAWLTAAAVAAIAGAMAVSGQPQIILYSFIIAATIIVPRAAATIARVDQPRQAAAKVIAATAVAGIIAVCLAAINILPLREFLPQTERNGTLPPEEYYEFSYPPAHAITLVLPYLFGNHDSYWGAKGFQELAAFVGVAPLLLSGLALTAWRAKRPEKISAICLIAIALLMATGRYSPLYQYLVEHHLLPALAVPGRFVYFFDVGIALLSACALEDLLVGASWQTARRRLAGLAVSLGALTICLLPFFLTLSGDQRAFGALTSLAATESWQLIPLWLGSLALPLIMVAWRWPGSARLIVGLISAVIAACLLLYAWDYNPRLPRALVEAPNAFAEDLSAYGASHMPPARLYSHERLLQSLPAPQEVHHTDPISPGFWAIQPLTASADGWQCLTFAAEARDSRQGTIIFSIHDSLTGPALRAASLTASQVLSHAPNRICFDPIPDSNGRTYFVRLTSPDTTGIQFTYYKLEHSPHQAYFFRTAELTPETIASSRKQTRLALEAAYAPTIDTEAAMLSRHLQVTANASSARWIGALSIHPYREFIETFFANDGEVIDGDGRHAIERNRRLLDLAGVTHLIQALPDDSTDTMADAGFTVLNDSSTGAKHLRLYGNPQAYPRAFLVPQAEWKAAADETRFAMMQPAFNPAQLAFISGDAPPEHLPQSGTGSGTAVITAYQPTEVEVATSAAQEMVLIMTDSTSAQWQTLIDGQRTLPLVADSVFKAAIVPAGTHTVTFRYFSAAAAKAKTLGFTGLTALGVLLTPALWKKIKLVAG